MSDHEIHKHKCGSCGTVWAHSRFYANVIDGDNSHNCPKCGERQPYKHCGDEIPATVNGESNAIHNQVSAGPNDDGR